MRNSKTVFIILITLLANNNLTIAQNVSNKQCLTVTITNIKSTKGQIIARLFRKSDDIMGKPHLQISKAISKKEEVVKFENLSYGDYVVFAIHDENKNKTLDHNFLGLPQEPFGFSNSWNFSLISGMPTYKKTKFTFSETNNSITIKVK